MRVRAVFRWNLAWGLGAAMSLSACAADPLLAGTPAEAPREPGLRVLVKTAQPEVSAKLLVEQAQAAAGVPVQYQAAMSPRWHALRLACEGPSACDAALRRLSADRLHFESVEPDAPRRANPAAPAASR